ncbi:sigma-70 family RNA polymerase sigma factor [Steroidobacter sp.]|uniref:sigma-70 family RNA polymerase sigma factor n=1 Tax=Steroidobacter sp. TaxID=1978227 RepID=UPI001A5E260D|nr:sigma-70 family RNA polymerase sigma factor [Steroidobacter sp.]MBL8270436.1 sigma-70 family RNA polymerase sigma factor [Steroidobacter sp.]
MSTDSPRERGRFEALCMPFRADVFRFVYWLCRDRALAEDVVQETLLRAWRSIDALDDEKAARPWLLTIARRELARVFERKRLPLVDIDAANEAEPDALATDDRHEVEEMRRAILKLDVVHREPLVLQVLLGYSTEEIARHLDISVAAVLTRLFRARQVLRQQLVGTEGARP